MAQINLICAWVANNFFIFYSYIPLIKLGYSVLVLSMLYLHFFYPVVYVYIFSTRGCKSWGRHDQLSGALLSLASSSGLMEGTDKPVGQSSAENDVLLANLRR